MSMVEEEGCRRCDSYLYQSKEVLGGGDMGQEQLSLGIIAKLNILD